MRLLIEERFGGNQSEFARQIGKSQSYINDVMNRPEKAFGEKACRQIEYKLGLPPKWLDHGGKVSSVASVAIPAAPAWPFPFSIEQWNAVPSEQRQIIIDTMVAAVRRSSAKPASRGRRTPRTKS